MMSFSGQLVAFRTDSSRAIGTGHLMRCLCLADAMRRLGAECRFISRQHPGHGLDAIRQRGYQVTALPEGTSELGSTGDSRTPRHTAWLGATWDADAEMTWQALGDRPVEWLVVDHYALDHKWESAVQRKCSKLMVIDDLADRPHQCDLLLDQNLGRLPSDYDALGSRHGRMLVGPRYALLRPEFAALREASTQRRKCAQLKSVVISMGGIDAQDATGQVLEALRHCALPEDCRITVVMGAQAPWIERARELARTLRWSCEVRVGVSDMAKVLADSDLAIGAAGSSSWERCCLGVPTVMVVLAENQREAAFHLEGAGAVLRLDLGPDLVPQLSAIIERLSTDSAQMQKISQACLGIVDGLGLFRVLENLQALGNHIREVQ